jgi:hypothetical protein
MRVAKVERMQEKNQLLMETCDRIISLFYFVLLFYTRSPHSLRIVAFQEGRRKVSRYCP